MPAVEFARGAVWLISGAAFVAIVLRPRRLPEATWAVLGAVVLVAFGLLPLAAAVAAVDRGAQVYAFLLGMLLLARLLENEGVFAWLAGFALGAAAGSRTRLFALVYGVGIVVTVFLSNDATAVVLTPAVAVAVGRVGLPPYPYLFACAFVANAASFVLPISNPANLVVFDGHLPRLGAWLGAFALSSALAVAATYAALWLASRGDLSGSFAEQLAGSEPLSGSGRVAGSCAALSAFALVALNAMGLEIGVPALICGLASLSVVSLLRPAAFLRDLRAVNYTIVPLVAGLFVIVAALDASGASAGLHRLFAAAASVGSNSGGALVLGLPLALACNLINNLPVGLSVAPNVAAAAPLLQHAALVGVDLGPNLALSGSLATLIWRDALAAQGIEMDGARFLRTGLVVLPAALVLALAVVR
jgi:arsenical pump membrane protein